MVSIGAPRNSDGGRRLRGDRCGSLTHRLRCSVRRRASQLTLARMDIDLAALPDDVETLHRMVRSLAVERTALAAAKSEIERSAGPRSRWRIRITRRICAEPHFPPT